MEDKNPKQRGKYYHLKLGRGYISHLRRFGTDANGLALVRGNISAIVYLDGSNIFLVDTVQSLRYVLMEFYRDRTTDAGIWFVDRRNTHSAIRSQDTDNPVSTEDVHVFNKDEIHNFLASTANVYRNSADFSKGTVCKRYSTNILSTLASCLKTSTQISRIEFTRFDESELPVVVTLKSTRR